MSTRTDTHPDYDAAPAVRRYTGSLRGLFTFLDFESKQRIGHNCWRILPGGAVVSMKRRQDGKRILRIARSKKPEGHAHEQAWLREIDTFVGYFVECASWHRIDVPEAKGVAVEFHEAEP